MKRTAKSQARFEVQLVPRGQVAAGEHAGGIAAGMCPAGDD